MARRWIPRLAALALAGGALWWWLQRRAAVAPEATTLPVAEPTAPAASTPDWVPPAEGACPAGYPVKVARSGIFHEPGGRSYDRTVPERCYATAAAAEADGYRRAKA
jgi:hypothetical protein